MGRFTNPLANVRVASPCPAAWDRMIGDERVRFCGQCQLNVFNLSAMSRADAESLIVGTEGRLCVRFYRRRDGSILTDDCPVGLRAIRQRVSRIKRAILTAVFGFLAGIGGTVGINRIEAWLVGSDSSYDHLQGIMVHENRRPEEAAMGQYVVGPPTLQGKKKPPRRVPPR